MKLTIALLVIYVLSLVIEVPVGLYMLVHRYGAAAAIGPGVIEAIFVALMIVFIFYGLRGTRWSYVGAMVVGILHAILSASIYFNSTGPPLAVAVYLTALPALLAIAAALAVLSLRRKAAT
ncbi:MAG TPA: hypothetical protein VHJ99_07065 [Candidatus Dormibacteraeota bacterium]|nr:hypothetical protein [Candidatus Dormibacteraeota bacterium]